MLKKEGEFRDPVFGHSDGEDEAEAFLGA